MKQIGRKSSRKSAIRIFDSQLYSQASLHSLVPRNTFRADYIRPKTLILKEHKEITDVINHVSQLDDCLRITDVNERDDAFRITYRCPDYHVFHCQITNSNKAKKYFRDHVCRYNRIPWGDIKITRLN